VTAVVPDVPGGSRKSLKVVAAVPDVPNGSERSLAVAAVIPDDPAAAEGRCKWSRSWSRSFQTFPAADGRWKWPRSFQTSTAAAEGRWMFFAVVADVPGGS